MSKEEFEELLKTNGKKIDDSIKVIEEANKRFNEKIKKILKAI